MPKIGSKDEKVKELTALLEQGVQDIFQSDQYKKWLNLCSKLHSYSINNQILIALQKPDAMMICGYSTWTSLGRHVVQGQKGIRILCPAPLRIKELSEETDPVTGKVKVDSNGKPKMKISEKLIPRYKVGFVWDVSQTEGKELPTLVTALDGSVKGYDQMKNALEKVAPVPISFEPIQGGANGFFHLQDKRIVINKGMSEQQTIKTMIHEITHSSLHDPDLDPESNLKSRAQKELEAESTAYVVCSYYGLDCAQYSFGYVASWTEGKDTSQLKRCLETIRATAGGLIDRIDRELYQEKTMDKTQDDLNEKLPGIIDESPFHGRDPDKKPTLTKPRRR